MQPWISGVTSRSPGSALAAMWGEHHPDIPARSIGEFQGADGIQAWVQGQLCSTERRLAILCTSRCAWLDPEQGMAITRCLEWAARLNFGPTRRNPMNAAQQLDTQEHFAALRRLLLSLQSDIKAAMSAARSARQHAQADGHAVADLKDEADRTQREAVHDAEISRVVHELQSVEDAFTRLRDGTYGICTHCHARIPGTRLAAQPAARFCFDCQTSQEHRR